MTDMKLKQYEYFRTDLGVLYCGDCLEILPLLDRFDLCVTSPPYDNIRKYCGYCFDFKNIALAISGKIVEGGVIVWVVGDATVNGSETGTSFKQSLFFMNRCGLNLHDTMVYAKHPIPRTHNRYEQAFEYMFVFSKGSPKTFNPLTEKTLWGGNYCRSATIRKDSNNLSGYSGNNKRIKPEKRRSNIWFYNTGFNKTTKDKFAFEHPAVFPTLLAQDHIESWSSPFDVIVDPFCGSGTTLKACERTDRRWIGIEISEKYCEIAKQRIERERQQLKLFPQKQEIQKPK